MPVPYRLELNMHHAYMYTTSQAGTIKTLEHPHFQVYDLAKMHRQGFRQYAKYVKSFFFLMSYVTT